MSTPIIVLAIIVSLATMSAAAADSAVAIITSDRAVDEAKSVVEAVAQSCSFSSGCSLPPNCRGDSAEPSTEPSTTEPNEHPTRTCQVCVIDSSSILQASVQIPFNAVLLKGLTPARGTYLSDLGIIQSTSLRGLDVCSG